MDLFSISFVSWHSVSICLNWFALLLLCTFAFLFFKYVVPYVSKLERWTYYVRDFQLDFGVGFSCSISCDMRVQEIAYKIWVELTTRKIGIEFEDNDVIEEVYNSWYCAFNVIRNLLEEIPAERLRASSDLVDLTIKVLNQGLRPHLTKWQARYRTWLTQARETEDKNIAPQELQKRFPEYEELMNDMKTANRCMIQFAGVMKDIAYRSIR